MWMMQKRNFTHISASLFLIETMPTEVIQRFLSFSVLFSWYHLVYVISATPLCVATSTVIYGNIVISFSEYSRNI